MSSHSNADNKENFTISINFNFVYNITIGGTHVQIEQRAEGGGQINRNVGMNANQGGQNANNHSETANNKSQFADGNGRSGIAGKENDELGGQQGIKVRDSEVINSILKSASAHEETTEDEKLNLEKHK
ncbi:hypothetical protein [Paenibacillus sp. GSMTC-2017]|uniref:hypothetical protein n=1 Tax=Paenibacillus sp. GSMTC-2017 TaxID=2794350 RepID=UPI001E5A40D6|nr:hypothetical protein [Paenibacillus sp. GSMTC-2017]